MRHSVRVVAAAWGVGLWGAWGSWAAGQSFANLTAGQYGPGERVTIDLGRITCYQRPLFGACTLCPPAGRCDSLTCTNIGARAYVTLRGTTALGGEFVIIVQPSGTSGFIGEDVATTAPLRLPGVPQLRDGEYDLIFDECEDGAFTAGQDSVVASFRVAGTPSGDIGNSLSPDEFNRIKANAAQQASHYCSLNGTVGATSFALQFVRRPVRPVISNFVPAPNAPQNFVRDQFGWGYVNYLTGVSRALLGVIRDQTQIICDRWTLIANDPPDPMFMQTVELGSMPLPPFGNDSAASRGAEAFGRSAARHGAALGALLAATEKFQGARDAGNAVYALKQARAVSRYARLALAWGRETGNAAEGFRAAVRGLPDDIGAAGAAFAELRARVAASGVAGFSASEVAALDSMGISAAGRAAAVQNIVAAPASETLLADLDQRVSVVLASLAANEAALVRYADRADAEAAALLATVTPNAPVAAASGGSAIAGTATVLSAAGTSDPDTPAGSLTYSWDLDQDGAFDDATGVAPSVVFELPGVRVVGVRVVDPQSNVDVAYALVTVAEGNGAPRVAQVPDRVEIVMSRPAVQDFSVETSDPESEPVAVTWWLNDSVVASGGSAFRWTTSATTPIGVHRVRAVVADSSPVSPDQVAEWLLLVGDVPVAQVEPSRLAMGAAAPPEGVRVRRLRISNVGSAALRIVGMRFEGGNAGAFEVSPGGGATISAGDVREYEVRFAPSGAGVIEAALRIETSDPDRDVVVIPVRGRGGCVADVDDGSGGGLPDGGVVIDDLLYYLGIFEAGVAGADVDDGSGSGTLDDGVGIEDLLYYLARYEAGC